MKVDMINSVIQDTPNRSDISDGTFTLGELHSDRLSLIINLFTLYNKLYRLKEGPSPLWIAATNFEGVEKEGHFHLGMTIPKTDFNLGVLVPDVVKDYFESLGSTILMQAPKYPPLSETLKVFNNG